MGHPDNLVHIDELLGILRERLHGKYQCLACDKTFKDYPTLRLHMRKKKHFQLPPHDPQYHRFYVVNAVEEGELPPPRAVESDDPDEMFSGGDDQDSVGGGAGGAGDDWADWDEEEDAPVEVLCLLCPSTFPSSTDCIEHMKSAHSFDLVGKMTEWQLDFFGRIKLINYIRRNVGPGGVLPQIALTDAFWSDVQYLFPAQEDDGLLTHEYAGENEVNPEQERLEAEQAAALEPPPEGLEEMGELLEKEGPM